ncbi:unnamed protein product [Coregonus sp. 'balchen']|nr:unnamed protein product [Coregonus sp. 'balchen']
MSDRFDCGECKESLYGRKYIQVEDVPHCIPCYDRLYANTCQECKELIAHNARELFYEDRHYHQHCFRCFRCDRSLADEPFTSQEEALLCNDCYCNEFSSKCVACDKTVMPDKDHYYCVPCYEGRFAPQCSHCKKALATGGVSYKDETWHKECFVCTGCKIPLAGQPFTSQGDTPYCDRQWHQPCFKCSRCSVSLVGAGFFPDRDQILCGDCNNDQEDQ